MKRKFTVLLKVTTKVWGKKETPDEAMQRLKDQLGEGRLEITGFFPEKEWSKEDGRIKGVFIRTEGTIQQKDDEGPNLTLFFIAHTIGKAEWIEKPKVKDIKFLD